MNKTLTIRAITGGAIGFFLSNGGITFTNWRFYVILVLANLLSIDWD